MKTSVGFTIRDLTKQEADYLLDNISSSFDVSSDIDMNDNEGWDVVIEDLTDTDYSDIISLCYKLQCFLRRFKSKQDYIVFNYILTGTYTNTKKDRTSSTISFTDHFPIYSVRVGYDEIYQVSPYAIASHDPRQITLESLIAYIFIKVGESESSI